MLTIAIPTYNRNKKLVRSIEALTPQLTEQVKILIIDNCSTIPVQESLGNRLLPNMRIIRNERNLGVSVNFLRCFENCDTEWMWLLGDDDPPHENAVATILQEIAAHSGFGFLNFKSGLTPGRTTNVHTTGPNEFISKIDDFGNLLFISLGVYNLKQLQSDFRLAYQLSYCMSPHMVLLFSGIGPDTQVSFLDKEIINMALYDTATEEIWSWLTLSLTIPILYEVPLAIGAQEKQKFAQLIKTHIRPPSHVYHILMQPRYYSMPTYDKRFILRQIFFRSLLFRSSSRYILSFIWSDLKLLLNDRFSSRKIEVVMARDERV